MQNLVYCTFQIEGTHNWPNCPFDEVAYLRVPHRHLFHFKVFVPVTHSDRDVEFIVFKHKLVKQFTQFWDEQSQLHSFGAMSCEMLGQFLIDNNPEIHSCEVEEDRENGARIFNTKMVNNS